MRNLAHTTIAIVLLTFLIQFYVVCEETDNVKAEEEKTPFPSFTFSLDSYSAYMWHGFNLYDEFSVQPSLASNFDFGDYGAVAASIWSHLPGGSNNTNTGFKEVDYTLSYSYVISSLTFSIGHAWYTYPSNKSKLMVPSNDIFGSVFVDTFLSPTLTVSHNYKFYDSNYFDLSFSHDFIPALFNEKITITPYINFGSAVKSKKMYEKQGLVQTTVGTNMTVPFGAIHIIPSINFTNGIDTYTEDEFWFGTKLSVDF